MTAEPTIPPEFLDPEEDAELLDPEPMLDTGATSTTTLRSLWEAWMCRKGGGTFVDVEFFGKTIGGVPAPAQDAYKALEQALRSAGYQPKSRWAYNCRKISGSNRLSLHSAGIAIDIDPKQNPFTKGDPYSGWLKKHHVDAALAIRNGAGRRVWAWGGNWSKPDRMHFQLDRGPDAVDVDWSTVPGADGVPAPMPVPVPVEETEENVLAKGAEGKAVKRFQEALLAWNAEALPKFGADGDYGDETVEWVEKYQTDAGLIPTGVIDGVTAALLQIELQQAASA